MKHLVIIGARGFGREVVDFARMQKSFLNGSYDIRGFLDDKADALDGLGGKEIEYPPILGPVETYEPQPDDVFFCALGDSQARKEYSEKILVKGGRFVSLIDDYAYVSPSAKIGIGSFVSGWSSVSANVEIGDFAVILPFCDIGHDVRIGDFCTLEAYCFCGGYSQIGSGTTMHVRSSILPGKKIGENCVVGTGAAVMRDFPDGAHLLGIPAVRFDF